MVGTSIGGEIVHPGWKDTWSRDSIVGPPVVPVAQDTDKRDFSPTYGSLLVSIKKYLERGQERKARRANQSIVQHTSNPFNQKFLWKFLCVISVRSSFRKVAANSAEKSYQDKFSKESGEIYPLNIPFPKVVYMRWELHNSKQLEWEGIEARFWEASIPP